MLRLVLGVALATALLATTVPAVEDAQFARSDHLASGRLDRIETAALTLAREEDPGARRVIDLSVPGDSPTAEPVTLSVGDVSGRRSEADTAQTDLLAYRVAGGRRHVRRIGVDLRVADTGESVGAGESADSPAIVLRPGETYRVTLRLVAHGESAVVSVAVGENSRRGTNVATATTETSLML